jgi:hypothetical protein
MSNFVHTNEKIKTPIGSLSFFAQTKEGDLGNCKITVCPIEPEIPKGMSVERCLSVLLRCPPTKPLKGFSFSCEWHNLQAFGYGNSGEALDAWEWESNGMLVMIGTEDSEWLNSRLGLDKEYSPESYPVKMNNNKITIEIEDLKENKELSLHFIIAWNSLPEPVECSCWYAVDVPHEKILLLHRKSEPLHGGDGTDA